MEKKIFFTVLIGSLLFLVVALLLPGRPVDENPKLPWKIEVDAAGSSTVFGLTLGRSTLADARLVLSDEGKVNLLIPDEGNISVEAYFDTIFLSGLKADFVMTMEPDQDLAEQMYHRGLRLGALESGGKKAELSAEDMAIAADMPIVHITYLPRADLDEDLIKNLFGEPDRIIKEPGTGINHWLYPGKGLDIAVDPERKEVFQYVSPADFQRMILAPLETTEMNDVGESGPDPKGNQGEVE